MPDGRPRFSRTPATCVAAAVLALLVAAAGPATPTPQATGAPAGDAFVRVSPRDARYLELSDGRPYVPIGLNLIAPDTADEQAGLARMDQWLGKLAANGGNYARVWLSSPFWDVEHERAGVFDERRAKRIEALLALARRHRVRVKLTLEHFREMSDAPRQRWANKPLHLRRNGGTADSVPEFFTGEEARARFRAKLAWFARRFGDDPVVYGWELWNEVNAARAEPEHYMPWTAEMLGELRRVMPRNLALQSLGSFDTDEVRELYRRHSRLDGNDVAQVHRYLDRGAALPVCHGPMDVLAADAVRELVAFGPRRPVLLAEGGAVEPSHSGPFALYGADRAGTLLHDVLFAPFFSGAAGPGQIWHWDVYVDRNDLWWHFARFAEAIRGLDPAAEALRPLLVEQAPLRLYALVGRSTALVWCRDARNTWRRELQEREEPERIGGRELDLRPLLGARRPGRVRVYDPWRDAWTEAAPNRPSVELPAFSRSLVLRVDLQDAPSSR